MSHLPASLDGSIERLAAAGYKLSVAGGFLLVSVPYLDAVGNLNEGILCDPLNFVNKDTVGPPTNHQMHFVGEQPCQLDGTPITMLGGSQVQTLVGGGHVSSFHFSMKLLDSANGAMRLYRDLFEKVATYATVIGGPATARHPDAEIKSPGGGTGVASPFVYVDAMSSHAELGELNLLFADENVAIIGGGGTGGYVLDFISKTPVRSITVFDDDSYHIKNSFRSPGVSEEGEFDRPKAEVLAERYSKFHLGVRGVCARITAESAALLKGVTFAFVCVDRGESRLEIAGLLRSLNIPFVDTGLGVDRIDGALKGMIRTTFVNEASHASVFKDQALPSKDAGEDVYHTNIQIVELNALNAALAVLRYKKYLGFYKDDAPEYNSLFVPGSTAIFKQLLEG